MARTKKPELYVSRTDATRGVRYNGKGYNYVVLDGSRVVSEQHNFIEGEPPPNEYVPLGKASALVPSIAEHAASRIESGTRIVPVGHEGTALDALVNSEPFKAAVVRELRATDGVLGTLVAAPPVSTDQDIMPGVASDFAGLAARSVAEGPITSKTDDRTLYDATEVDALNATIAEQAARIAELESAAKRTPSDDFTTYQRIASGKVRLGQWRGNTLVDPVSGSIVGQVAPEVPAPGAAAKAWTCSVVLGDQQAAGPKGTEADARAWVERMSGRGIV